MRHALVTGAAGFIGSHLVDRLLADDWRVTAVDNFDPLYSRDTKERNIADHLRHGSYRLFEVDVRDLDGMRARLTGNYKVIVHLAARAGVRPSILDPLGYQDVNVTGTHNLLELARELRIPQFVFASSASAYGLNPNLPWREEDHAVRPISPYAGSKVSGELLGHVYSHLHDIRFIALRLFSAYGPRQRPDLAISRFARRMLDGRPVSVFGDGSTSRDYTYIDDMVAGIRSAMDYRRSRFEIVNVGTSRTVTLTDTIRALERVLGVKAVVESQPEQAGVVPQTRASVEKARRLLRFEPRTSFQTGLRRFADWLVKEEAASAA